MILLEAAAAVGVIALAKSGAAFAASLAVIGAALGISRIGQASLEALARQPEAAGDIRSNIIILAALIEGVAFFAIITAMLVLFLV